MLARLIGKSSSIARRLFSLSIVIPPMAPPIATVVMKNKITVGKRFTQRRCTFALNVFDAFVADFWDGIRISVDTYFAEL